MSDGPYKEDVSNMLVSELDRFGPSRNDRSLSELYSFYLTCFKAGVFNIYAFSADTTETERLTLIDLLTLKQLFNEV